MGHETDFTICDFVADLRAPTPSAAAELATPDIKEQRYYISSLKYSLENIFNSYINDLSYDLNKLTESQVLKNPEKIIENCEMYLDSLNERINQNFTDILTDYSNSFAILCSKLNTLSPLNILSRGYSIIKKENEILTDVKQIDTGDIVSIQLKNGMAKAEIIEV